MWRCETRSRIWTGRMESSQRGPPLLQRMYHQTAGVLAMFPVQRTQATSRVHSLAAKSETYAGWYTSMQCMHSLCLRVSSCSSHESTLGPLAPTRIPSTTRSNPSTDVCKKIQKIHEARQTSMGTDETRTGVAHSSTQQLAVEPDTATPRVYTYLCPHCAKSVQSTVATGQVYHRRGDGCGKKFRVANGLLAGRTLAHTCPTCGTVVHSTKASGQIQITHRTPNGKQCRTDRWPVQNWSQTEPSPNNRTLRARHAETAGPWRTDRACRPPPSVPNVAFCTYKKTNSLSCLPAAKAQTRRARHTETAGPWGTDRACGPGPPQPNVAFWTYKKASCLTCLPAAKAHTRRDCHAKTTGSWGTDRACGPRPPRPVFQPPRLTQGALATPKQQGPEGRTGPAGHGPHCLTLLSEPTRKLAVWPKTAPPPQPNSKALRDGPGLRATAPSAERCFLHLQEN